MSETNAPRSITEPTIVNSVADYWRGFDDCATQAAQRIADLRNTLAAQRTALLDAQAQLAALEAKRREDVRKCAEICNSFSLDPVPQKRIRAAFPEDFK